MNKPNKKSFNIHIDVKTKERCKEMADELNTSMSQLITIAVNEKYLKDMKLSDVFS